ncbi:MAG TPA: DUF3536 domain-containing protein [Gemmatimonadales bacterium]|jgi:hypothetical protein
MRDLVIHGHFYQPPREDPWLELTPRELSASPDHDWNERITRQCYEPLARGQIVDAQGRLTGLINAYAWCSFDIGPSLFRWFDDHAPHVGAAIVAGDRESAARLGHGNAIAMPYHHAILPLLSRRDKVTEVRWGVRDFVRRFGRDPMGIWLPEAAVDDETLDVLAQERIRFTVLSPGQVDRPPSHGRPGRWRGPSGEVAVFVYDGPSAHNVAFGGALDDVSRWEAGLMSVPLADDGGATVVSLATDGETFGHHHRQGDLALASLLDRVSQRSDARMTNFAAILATTPPAEEITLVSPSSWSCPHGVGRWFRDCGCHYEPNTSQAWRAPLRQGLDTLATGIHEVVERDWPASAGDLWRARDAAGPGLLFAADAAPGIVPADTDGRKLLDALTHALAMFTSCAWFFDDIGRLEPRIVLRHAARALELLPDADAMRLEGPLVATLATAHSNDPEKGDGAAIWQRDVLPDAAGPAHLAAGLGALRELAPGALDDVIMPAHRWEVDGDALVLMQVRIGEQSRWHVAGIVNGVIATHADVRLLPDGIPRVVSVAAFPDPIRGALREAATPLVLDAALVPTDMVQLRAGLLDRDAARERALYGALALLARDGMEAGVVAHGVLDLYDLEHARPSDAARASAFLHLAALPAAPIRDLLAERFGVRLAATPAP